MEARTPICVCKELVELLLVLTLRLFAGSARRGGLLVLQRNVLVFSSGELTSNFQTRGRVISDMTMYDIDML